MAPLDKPMTELAQRMITRHGTLTQLSRKASSTGGIYDPATGTVSGSAPDITSVHMFPAKFSQADLMSGIVNTADLKLMMCGKDFELGPAQPGEAGEYEPKTGDILTWSGIDYRVTETTAVYSGQRVALWYLYCKS